MADKPKTRKSISKRFKFTKKGKVVYRLPGQDHFLAKRKSKRKRKLHRPQILNKDDAKRLKKALHF